MPRQTTHSAARAMGPVPISTLLVNVTSVAAPDGRSVQRLTTLRNCLGQALDAVGQRRRRVELDDALHQRVSPDLHTAGGAHRAAVGSVIQDARVIGVVRP